MVSLKGHLLVAAPALLDPNFAQSVLLIVDHDESGALAVILNRPLKVELAEVWPPGSDLICPEDIKLFQGGPCSEQLLALHENPELSQVTISPGMFFTGEPAALESLILDNTQPRKFFVGYAGWGAWQLESELYDKGWLVVPATRQDIFDTPDDLWTKLLERAARAPLRPNIDPRRVPPDPSQN